MQLHEIKGTLEHILSNPELQANARMKIEVIKLLKLLQGIITPEELRRIKLLVQLSLKMQSTEIDFMLSNSEEVWSLTEKTTSLKEVVYPLNDGFISHYLDFTSDQESPVEFHFWASVSILAGALRRNVYFDKQGYYSVYPSHFIILVAKSGACKKSTSINLAVDILRDIDVVNIMPEKSTPEALFESLLSKRKIGDSLITECYGMIYASELSMFLGKQSYNEGMVPLLTDLADCPSKRQYKTRSKGQVTLINPGLTFLGGTTKEGLQDCLPITAFGQGFMSRILFIHKDGTPRVNPMIEPIERNRYPRELLKEELRRISEVQGQFTVSSDGIDWYNTFYMRNKMNQVHDPNLSGYFERKPDHLIRLAMVLAISECKSLILTGDLFERAKFALEQAEQPMPEAFIDRQATPSGQNCARLMNVIKQRGGKVSWSGGMKAVYRYMNKDEFRRAVDTLVEAKLVDEYKTRSEHMILMRNLE